MLTHSATVLFLIYTAWLNLENWKKTAESSRGRNYLLWQWLRASDDVRAKMPESLQIKITSFYDGDTKALRSIIEDQRKEWSEVHKQLWDMAPSEWPKKIDRPTSIMDVPDECMWYN